MIYDNIIKRINESIALAEMGISNLPNWIYFLNGQSSPKIRRLLNLLGYFANFVLEVGCWRGSTLISTLYNNKNLNATIVENFSQFNDVNNALYIDTLISMFDWAKREFIPKYDAKTELLMRLKQCGMMDQCNLIVGDFFAEETQIKLREENKKFDIYFYDALHDEESQKQAIEKVVDILNRPSIILIDDWNMESVQTGTIKGIQNTDLKVIRQWILLGKHNGDMINFWNSLSIFLVE